MLWGRIQNGGRVGTQGNRQWALFIGGPLDGRWRQLEDAVPYYAHVLPGGGMVPYTRRDGITSAPNHLVYAPVGMAIHHVFDKARQAGPPPAR